MPKLKGRKFQQEKKKAIHDKHVFRDEVTPVASVLKLVPNTASSLIHNCHDRPESFVADLDQMHLNS